jgi:protein-disulfide isomerase
LLKYLIPLLFAASGCLGNQSSPDLNQRIEKNVRAQFKIPRQIAVEVGPRRPNPSYGDFDQITITLVSGERRTPYEFLLSKDGNTLLRLAPMDISKDPFDPTGRPSRGASPTDAKVTIVVYDDFQCPYCAQGHKTLMTEILPEYKSNVRVVYKDYPLDEIHPWAIRAAVNANCLFDQKNDAYWDFTDYVHANQREIRGLEKPKPVEEQLATLDQAALSYGNKHKLDVNRLQTCLKAQDESAVRASMKYAEDALGVQSTPTMFINGQRVEGAIPVDELRQVLDAALRDVGATPPERKAASKGATAKEPKQANPGGGLNGPKN